ncbi:MAG: MerR family transcriptional regulator, partial [Spirochaetales bacterium]|nr:MerR family transcriptional regulator [Spirochaetales bacterium]
YRYYDETQLPDIRRILMLKGFGLTLEEIQGVNEDESRLPEILKRKESELKASIRDDMDRLKGLRLFLSDQREEKTMEVCIKSLPEVIVASMRTTVPDYSSYFTVVPKMGEYMEKVGAVCAEPAYCFNIYHDGEYRESDIDVEICEAVVKAEKESEKVKFKTIDAIPEAACILHKGPYETLRESYNTLFDWIGRSGYRSCGLPRESYIDGIWNRDDPSQWLTEIQVPVEKIS